MNTKEHPSRWPEKRPQARKSWLLRPPSVQFVTCSLVLTRLIHDDSLPPAIEFMKSWNEHVMTEPLSLCDRLYVAESTAQEAERRHHQQRCISGLLGLNLSYLRESFWQTYSWSILLDDHVLMLSFRHCSFKNNHNLHNMRNNFWPMLTW